MIAYWILFLIPAWASLTTRPNLNHATRLSVGWIIFGVSLALMIGFRYEVGGDWRNYIRILHSTTRISLWEAVTRTDPAYVILNWSLGKIWAVNLVCGVAFAYGLIVICLRQPHAWLAMMIAIPYLVVVVALGYSRQGVAVGLAMLALIALQDRLLVRFLFWITFASLFHRTALLVLPIGLLATTQNRIYMAAIGGLAGVILYTLLLQADMNSLIENYIERNFNSSGAATRITMNAIPSVIFLLYRKKFAMSAPEMRLWTYMSWCGLFFVVLFLVSPSSTAIDRMALYFIPLQLVVYSRLPAALCGRSGNYSLYVLGLIFYSAAILFVWLNYSEYADNWIPFKLYPLEDL